MYQRGFQATAQDVETNSFCKTDWGRSGWDEAVSNGSPTRFSGYLTAVTPGIARIIGTIIPAMIVRPRRYHDRRTVNGINGRWRIVNGGGINRIGRGVTRNPQID